MKLECGTAYCDISPAVPVEMIGMGLGNRATGTESPLELRVFVFRNGDKGFSLVTCDLLCIDRELAETVKTKMKASGVPFFAEHEIFISCSHTHWGPAVMAMRGDQKQSLEYRTFVIDKIIHCLHEAFDNLSEVEMSVGKTRCEWNVNRRVTVDGEAVMLPMLPELACRADGPVDREVTVAAFMDREGKYKAILFNYGCHPIDFPIHYDRISSAFPGEVARMLRKKFHCLCGFTNGGLGDVCMIGALQGAVTKEYVSAALVKRIAELLEGGGMENVTTPEIATGAWDIPVQIQDSQHPDWINLFKQHDRSVPFRYELGYYRIGEWMAGAVPGECSAAPAIDFKRQSGYKYAHICSLTNGSWGYMLYRDEYSRKGYEPTGALTEAGETEKIIASLLQNI